MATAHSLAKPTRHSLKVGVSQSVRVKLGLCSFSLMPALWPLLVFHLCMPKLLASQMLPRIPWEHRCPAPTLRMPSFLSCD